MKRAILFLAAFAAIAQAALPASALNPQPLPPKQRFVSKLGIAMLNPQPLPPRYRLFHGR